MFRPFVWAGELLSKLAGFFKGFAVAGLLLGLLAGGAYVYSQTQIRQTAPPSVSAPASMPSASAPAVPKPQPAPPPAQAPDREAMLARAANAVGAELVGYEPRPDGAVVTIRFVSSQTDLLGDFLEQARRDGAIRDFDIQNNMGAQLDEGRTARIASAKVFF